MARSVTFTIDSGVDTQITITENDNGTLSFEIQVLGSGLIGDLRALFFDLNGLVADDDLHIVTGTDVTDTEYDEADVSNLGQGANINGSVVNELGEFDVGIEFGTAGMSDDDIQAASFTLGHYSTDLSLDMIDLADFGVRYTSVGEEGGNRNGSLKAGDQANGVAQNDTLDVIENGSGTTALLANDTNGANLSVSGVWDDDGAFDTVPGGFERQVYSAGLLVGTLTIDSSGTATFAASGPGADALAGSAVLDLTFTYQTTAPDGSHATADVILAVIGINDAPAMADGNFGTDEDSVSMPFDLSILGSDVDSDDDGTTLGYSIINEPAEGSASISGSLLSFDPGSDFQDLVAGATRDVTIEVQAIDSHGASATGTVTVTVTGTNDAPVAVADLTVTDEETVLTGNLFADNGSSADFDPDAGDTFSIHTVDGQPAVFGVPITLASGATLILQANGDFTFDPRGAFDFVPEGGQSADGIDYTVIDQHGAISDEVRANFSVQGVNDAPRIFADAGDSTGGGLTETDAGLTLAGTLTVEDLDLTDEVTATVTDVQVTGNAGTLTSAQLLAMFTVPGVILPGATPFEAQFGWSFDSGAEAFDHLADGEVLELQFTIRPDDGHGPTTTGDGVVTVRIIGTPDNEAPLAVADTLAATEDTPAVFDVLGNDIDADGDPLSVATINGAAVSVGDTVATQHGTLTVNADGTLGYTADVHYSGPDSFTYTASDGQLGSNPVTASIDVAAVADAPDLSLDSAAGGSDAAPVSTGPDVQINTTTAGTQTDPSVTALANGGFIVTWNSFQSGQGYDSLFQIYDANGAPIGGETVVGGTTGTQRFPDVLALPDGGFVIAYSSDSGVDGSGQGIYTQRFDAAGAPVGGEVLVNTTTANTQQIPSIEALDGGYVVSWESFANDGTAYNIFTQSYDASGTPVGGETLISGAPANPEYDTYSAVAGLAGGGHVVTWTNWVPGTGQFEALAQVVDATGVLSGPPIQLNTQTSSIATYSSVLATPDGGFVVVWTQDNPGENRKLVMSRFDANGALIEGEVEVSQIQPTIQHAPGITLLDDGGFLISWSALNADDSSGGMFGRRYDAQGNPLSDEFLINDTQVGQQHPVTNAGNRVLTTLEDGTVVSVWGTDHGNGELFFRFIDVPATADGVEDQPMDILLDAALVDTDGSESLRITLSSFPAGATFNLGAAQGSDWVIENAETVDLSTLQMTPPSGFSGDFTLTAVARATEASNGDFAETSASVALTIAASPKPPLFTNGDEVINFGGQALAGTLPVNVAGTYLEGTQYDGLNGADQVWLADTAADAAAAGYAVGTAFHGGLGRDTIYGGGLDDHIIGGEGNDNLQDRGGGNNTLEGGEGNDRLIILGAGDDHVDGGNGSDHLSWNKFGPALTVDIGAGTATGQGYDTFANIEIIDFTNLNDVVTGGAQNLRASLFDGDDVFNGGSGSEWVKLGEGDDTFDGGAHSDRVDFGLASTGVTVDLTAGTATGQGNDILMNVEQVLGSAHDDLIIGSSTIDPGAASGFGVGYNGLFGGAGNDTIYGLDGDDDLSDQGAGDDLVFGGDGNDVLGGNVGDDTLDGGAGTDTAYYANILEAVDIDLNTGVAVQSIGTDTLISIENVTGSRGDDTITGDSGDNILHGWFGSDTMTGGAGADTFVFDLRQGFSGDNVITDFEVGTDTLRMFGDNTINTLADLNPTQVGNDVLLELTNGTTLTLENILLVDLSDSDFDF